MPNQLLPLEGWKSLDLTLLAIRHERRFTKAGASAQAPVVRSIAGSFPIISFHVGLGSKCDKLVLSKCFPLLPR